MVKTERPDNALERGLHLGRLGMRLTGSYVGYQLQNLWLGNGQKAEHRRHFQRKASRQIREELQTLKGPVMKLGQMLSMQSGLLSPEALEELSALQMHAPGMHPTLARVQFKSSCGKYPEEVFREFEPEPFAAASLGQVHRAETQSGKTVAVKLQYPGIRTAVENDFKLLRSATVAGRITGHIPKALLEEIETRIVQETDYLQEGRNLDTFRTKLRPLTYVQVPKVFWKLTSDRVLTMSYVTGSPLGEWLAHKPSVALRNLVGSRLFELFWFQVLRVGALHADPHPGNYLYSDAGEIGLVDFGCVKEIETRFPDLIRVFVQSDALTDQERAARMAQLIWGEQTPRKNAEIRRLMQTVLEFSRRVYPTAAAVGTVVDFGDPTLFAGLARISKEVIQNKLVRPDFIFFKRAEFGLYNVLHQLGARLPTIEIIRRVRQ